MSFIGVAPFDAIWLASLFALVLAAILYHRSIARYSAEAARGRDEPAAERRALEPNAVNPLYRASYYHPLPDESSGPYDSEGPYFGAGAGVNRDSATSYFYRLYRIGGLNPMEAALTARGLGDIRFGDDFSPKRMLEVGMAWVMERADHRGRFSGHPTWEERYSSRVTGRYIELTNGRRLLEEISESEKKAIDDRDREAWVHQAMRLLYPSWALEGVIPEIETAGGEVGDRG